MLPALFLQYFKIRGQRRAGVFVNHSRYVGSSRYLRKDPSTSQGVFNIAASNAQRKREGFVRLVFDKQAHASANLSRFKKASGP